MSEKNYKDGCKAAIFLFAHQDDESGVFQLILDEIERGMDVSCYYLTSGTFNGMPSDQRNHESLRVLLNLGVKEDNIHFIGSKKLIADCDLINQLDYLFDFISKLIVDNKCKPNLYLPAWEGGHSDHDALHVAGVLAAYQNGMLEMTYQASLYNSKGCYGPWFKVLHPIIENGEVYKSKISLKNRFRFIKYCLSYPSQKTSWIGLFPFFLLHYLINGYQTWQPVSIDRIKERQHKGSLYFDYRGFCDEFIFFKKINSFIDITL